MSFPNSNFEGNLCYASHFDIIVTWKVYVGHRDIYYAKYIKFFVCVEVRILCKKVKYVWGSHFPEAITTNMQLGITPFCLNTRLRVNKTFKIHINFIEISVNVCLLCAPHVMTSIILHTRRPNCQYKVCYALGSYV